MSGATVNTDVQITADVDLTESVNAIAGNFLTLYQDKWFLVSIIIAFFAAQIVHVIMRTYFVDMMNGGKLLIICAAHLFVGYIATYQMVTTEHVAKLAWFAGVNSFVAYHLALWVAVKWFPMPRLARFLSLREAKVNESGEVDLGDTIYSLRKRGNK